MDKYLKMVELFNSGMPCKQISEIVGIKNVNMRISLLRKKGAKIPRRTGVGFDWKTLVEEINKKQNENN